MGRFERRWRAASRRNWAILAVCVALVLGRIWMAIGEHPTPGVVLLPQPLRSLVNQSSLPAARAAQASAAQMTVPVGRPGEVEVCGLGWVAPNSDRNVDPVVLDRVPDLEAASRRILASLAASDDEFDRAALVWLQVIEPTLRGDAAADKPAGCEGGACPSRAQAQTTSAGFLEQLAQAATRTRDPRVYALSFTACKKSQTGSCSLLNARRWAQLDPDNGEPWLHVLGEAVGSKDSASVDEALFRIGTASRIDSRYYAIPRILAQRATSTEAELQATNVITIVSIGGLAARVSPIGPEAWTRVCQVTELADANGRQRCEAAALALTERSDTLLDAALGARIGRRLGWSEARAGAVTTLGGALRESLPTHALDAQQWSCANVTGTRDRLLRLSELGEIGFAREWIAGSGVSLERYAAAEAERRRRRVEVLMAAASAAEVAEAAASAATPYSATPPPAR